MPITEKLKPLADSILAALVDTRLSAEDPTAITKGENAGTLSTKDIMAKIGVTDITKVRAVLKELKREHKIFRLGNTRSTLFKAKLPSDDADSDGENDDADTAATIKSLQDEAHAASDASDTGRVPRMTSDSLHVLKGADTLVEGEIPADILASSAATKFSNTDSAKSPHVSVVNGVPSFNLGGKGE